MAVLLLKVAQHSGIKGPVRLENLAREKRQRRETLHGNQEEGCEEEKETLSENQLADPRFSGPRRRSTSREAFSLMNF
jgi:hypothetical protein